MVGGHEWVLREDCLWMLYTEEVEEKVKKLVCAFRSDTSERNYAKHLYDYGIDLRSRIIKIIGNNARRFDPNKRKDTGGEPISSALSFTLDNVQENLDIPKWKMHVIKQTLRSQRRTHSPPQDFNIISSSDLLLLPMLLVISRALDIFTIMERLSAANKSIKSNSTFSSTRQNSNQLVSNFPRISRSVCRVLQRLLATGHLLALFAGSCNCVFSNEMRSFLSGDVMDADELNVLGTIVRSSCLYEDGTMNLSKASKLFEGGITERSMMCVWQWMIDKIKFDSENFYDIGNVFKPMELHNVQERTILLHDGDIQGEAISISNCYNGFIYILAPASFVSITACKSCTIVLGTVSKLLSVEKCHDSKIICVCTRSRISSCTSSKIHLACVESSVLLGYNHDLKIAPYNTCYPLLESHMEHSRISCAFNRWKNIECCCTCCMSRQIDSRVSNDSFEMPQSHILDPGQFEHFVIPFSCCVSDEAAKRITRLTKWNPFTVPIEYRNPLQEKLVSVDKLKEAMDEAVLLMDNSVKMCIQHQIQQQFGSWLLETDQLRQIEDLVRMNV